MSKQWPKVKLGEVVMSALRAEAPITGTTYRQIGVKLWGEGAYERETMDGSQTKYAQLFRAEAGDIIVNKIWARNGSITGAPKFRAMEIIDELEPVARGVYCGAIGYLGFNRESQLSIVIRTAVCHQGAAHFNVGAGIVADSRPEAEYEETLAKAGGFLAALALKRVGKAVEI